MNERIAFAAMAILLAASVATQTRSPEFVALAGTYVATAGFGDVAVRHVLTLGEDGKATLQTAPHDADPGTEPETGAWMLDGTTIQLGLSGDESRGPRALTLRVEGDELVVAGADGSASWFAGLTFTRSGSDAPARSQ